MKRTVEIPLKTAPGQNVREHHMQRSRRVRRERNAAFLMTPMLYLPAHMVITVTRISPGTLDQHDNLRGALKGVVDGIADKLGIKDNDPRVEWRYAQAVCPRREFGVRIEMEWTDDSEK